VVLFPHTFETAAINGNKAVSYIREYLPRRMVNSVPGRLNIIIDIAISGSTYTYTFGLLFYSRRYGEKMYPVAMDVRRLYLSSNRRRYGFVGYILVSNVCMTNRPPRLANAPLSPISHWPRLQRTIGWASSRESECADPEFPRNRYRLRHR